MHYQWLRIRSSLGLKFVVACCAVAVSLCVVAEERKLLVTTNGIVLYDGYNPYPSSTNVTYSTNNNVEFSADGLEVNTNYYGNAYIMATDQIFLPAPRVSLNPPTTSFPPTFNEFDPDITTYPASPGVVPIFVDNVDKSNSVVMTSEHDISAIYGQGAAGYASALARVGSGNLLYDYGSYLRFAMLGDASSTAGFIMAWPEVDRDFCDPIYFNKTDAWWLGPDNIRAGDTFSIYGKNLVLEDTNALCAVYIDGYSTNDMDNWKALTSGTEYKATFTAPEDIASGVYTCYVHNGSGDIYGFGRGLTLVISDPIDYTGATNTVTANSFSSLKTEIEGAGAGETVYVPNGTYSFTSQIDGSDVAHNVWIQGESRTGVVFTADATLAEGSSLLYFGDDVPNSSSQSAEKVYGMKISGITFDYGDHTPELRSTLSINGMYAIVEDCAFSQTNLTERYTDSTDNINLDIATFTGNYTNPVIVRNCKFYNYKSIGLRNYVQFVTNEVYGIFDASKPVESYGGRNVDVSNCSNQNFDDSDVTSDWWGSGRFFIAQQRSFWHYYIGDNTTTNMKPRFDPANEWYDQVADQNAAEQIMSEDTRPEYIGSIQSATASTVTDTWFDNAESGFEFYSITIIDGKGFGQTRPCLVTRGSETATLFEDWEIVPDTTSTFTLHKCGWRNLIIGNYLDGRKSTTSKTASAGVSLYGGPNECIVANNTIQQTESGVLVWGYSDDGFSGRNGTIPNYAETTYFNLIDNNTVKDLSGRLNTTEPYDYGKHAYDIRYRAQTSSYAPMVSVLGTVFRDNTFSNANTSLRIMNSEPTMTFNANVFEGNEGTSTNGFTDSGGVHTYTNNNSITLLP